MELRKNGHTPARRLRLKPVALALVSLCIATAYCESGYAMDFHLDNGLEGSFDSILSLGVAMRTSSPMCEFIGKDNGGCATTDQVPIAARDPANFSQMYDVARLNQDDGNQNYKRGQVYSSQLRGVHDLYAKAGSSGWSGLMRFSWFNDFTVDNTKRMALDPDAKRYAVSDVRLLDAYVNKEFEIGSETARMRVGNQVLSWGEDIFITGGINSINAIDIRKAHQPGVQLKEIFTPAPMVSLSSGIGSGLGVEAYYQWKWNAFDFDAPGTFFSTADFLGRGAHAIYLPSSTFATPPSTVGDNGTFNQVLGRQLTMSELNNPAVNPLGFGTVIGRDADVSPKNSGQYGFAIRYKSAETDDELGIYYYRYHEKIPFLSFRVDQGATNPLALGAYFFEFGQDRNLYGVSYNTRLGEWAVGMEGSYRPKDSVPIDPTIVINPANPYYCNGDANPANFRPTGYVCHGAVYTSKYQFHLTGIHIMSPSGTVGWLMNGLGAAEGTILAEAAVAYYPGLNLDAGIPYAVTSDYAVPTRTSMGFVLSSSLTYPAIFGTRVSLMPDITFSQGARGISPTPMPGFIKGAGAATLGFTFDFKTKPATKARIDFTQNYGGGLANNLRDRNFMTMTLSTSF